VGNGRKECTIGVPAKVEVSEASALTIMMEGED